MLRRIVTDSIVWTLSAVLCILWRVVADKSEVWSYVLLFAGMMVVWIVLSVLSGKYNRSYRELWLWQEVLALLSSALVMLGLVYLVLPRLPWQFSPVVAMWMVGIVAVAELVVLLLLHYYKYAMSMDVPPIEIQQRENARLRFADSRREQESVELVHQSVLALTTEEDYRMLYEHADLGSRLTKVVANREMFGLMQLPRYSYKTIVDLTLLNDIRGINKRFCCANEKLPDGGRYVVCYRPQEYMKQKFLNKYPRGINWVMYTFYFINKRVIPKLMLTSRAYYDITRGRKRMLSKTEVLGRLYYCGFEVDEVVPMGHIEYVFCHRHSQPYPQMRRLYGPIIKLPRVSKDKEMVYFYKFRTMHPYSEYIQKYVFDQGGGMNIADKASNDWRISNWGAFLRKYWLDELPMIYNWIRRDMKLVGVRPLSKTMFAEYPPELQELRTQVLPGLIPPFYIDHPKTFDELFASEEKYLRAYLKHPLWTDIRYFFMTMWSILFKKVHSA